MTKQRRVILEVLKNNFNHPTADEVFELVRTRLPKISLGTVYRNLEILSETGLLKKVEAAGSPRRFDANTARHTHIRCIRCGRVADLDIEPEVTIERDAIRDSGYRFEDYCLELRGVCKKCLKSGAG